MCGLPGALPAAGTPLWIEVVSGGSVGLRRGDEGRAPAAALATLTSAGLGFKPAAVISVDRTDYRIIRTVQALEPHHSSSLS